MNIIGAIVAPNTSSKAIKRNADYHSVKRGTSMGRNCQPAKCRRCGIVANPTHVTDYPKHSLELAVWCVEHCPACKQYRAKLESEKAMELMRRK